MRILRIGRGPRWSAVGIPALVAGIVLASGLPAAGAGAQPVERRVLAGAAAVPGAPTLDGLTPGDETLQVNWSFGNPNLGVTGYTATAQPGGAHCDAPGRFSSQCTITGLTNGIQYTVQVVAHHLTDGDSAPSNSLAETPGRSLTWSASNVDERKVTIIWQLNSEEAPQKFVARIGSDPIRQCEVAGNQDSCVIELLPFGTHSLRITAVYADATKNLVVEPDDVTIVAPDEDVTITGVAVAGHDATISWQHNVVLSNGNGRTYQAVLHTDPPQTCSGPELQAATPPAETAQCTIEDLPYDTYRVQVDMYYEGLDATSQLYTFVVAPPGPASPAGMTLTPGVSHVVASWQAPTDSEVPITGYRATASPGPASCTTTGATTCLIGGTAGQSYTVTVVALSAGGGESVPSEPSEAATPIEPAPGDDPPDTKLKLTTDDGRIKTAVPGQSIVFIGKGFAAYSTAVITVYSSHRVLAIDEADSDGDFRKRVNVPTNLAPGWHTIVVLGIAPDGSTRAMAIRIRVIALALTGVNPTAALLLGAVLVGVGVALYLVARRLRRLPFGL